METMATHTVNRILLNRGVFGGYPGNVFYAYIVRNANTRELIEKGLPLPQREGDPRDPDILKMVKGDISRAKAWWHTKETLHDYDIIQNCMHSNNGGLGDPIERDTGLIKSDLDLGLSTIEACRNIYCAEASYSEKDEEWTIDDKKTAELRQQRKQERKQRGVPFQQWWQGTREKILRGRLPPLLLEMYGNSMKKGPRFAQEFRDFWGLPPDFSFEEVS